MTLDPDTEALLRREMSLHRQSFKEALNAAVRRAFRPTGPSPGEPYRVHPFHSGYQSGIDRLRLNQVADELATDAFLDSSPSRE